MESTWIHLENLDSNEAISDDKKIRLIDGKLANTKYSTICMNAMKLPEGDTLTGFLKHLRDYIKHSDDAGGAQSRHNANHVSTRDEAERQIHATSTLPDFDPWTSTYR